MKFWGLSIIVQSLHIAEATCLDVLEGLSSTLSGSLWLVGVVASDDEATHTGHNQ